MKPYLAFELIEKKSLIKLPDDRFEIPDWRKVKVHPDRFIQFDKKRYGLPEEYTGYELWAKKSGNIVYVYHKHQVLRQFTVPKKHYTYHPEDFPEVLREMMEGKYPQYLLEQSKFYGKHAHKLIEHVLTPHAYLNARRALGILGEMKKHYRKPYFDSVCNQAMEYRVTLPSQFRKMMEQEEAQINLELEAIPVSKEGENMVRDLKYYFKEEEKNYEQ
jgi:hypothetical protein